MHITLFILASHLIDGRGNACILENLLNFSGLKLDTPILLARPRSTRFSIAVHVSLREGTNTGPLLFVTGLQTAPTHVDTCGLL